MFDMSTEIQSAEEMSRALDEQKDYLIVVGVPAKICGHSSADFTVAQAKSTTINPDCLSIKDWVDGTGCGKNIAADRSGQCYDLTKATGVGAIEQKCSRRWIDIPAAGQQPIFHGGQYYSVSRDVSRGSHTQGFGLAGLGAVLRIGQQSLRRGAELLRRRMLVDLEITRHDKSYPWVLSWMTRQYQGQVTPANNARFVSRPCFHNSNTD